MRPLAGTLLTSAVLGLLVAGAAAQDAGGAPALLHQVDGAFPLGDGGWSLSKAFDYDADGHADVLISFPTSNFGKGMVSLRSGKDFSELLAFHGGQDDAWFGYSVTTMDDLDGDGMPEVVVGSKYSDPAGIDAAGSAYVISPGSGATLLQFHGSELFGYFGHDVECLGDIDADGVADLACSAVFTDPGGITDAGSVFVYSGASGALIRRHDGAFASGRYGWAVANLGDLDGDSVPDYAIGAPEAEEGGVPDSGSVHFHSGASGALIDRVDGAEWGDRLGRMVARVADLDGDGVDEVAVGAPRAARPANPFGSHGLVMVLSGADRQVLRRIYGEQPDGGFGSAIADVGDVDGDGFHDLLVGAPSSGAYTYSDSGEAILYSGRNARRMCAFQGSHDDAELGYAVAAAGDLDADGLPDLLLGAPGEGGWTQRGYAQAHRYDPFLRTAQSTLSLGAGDVVQLELAFPASEALRPFRILASARETGSVLIGNLRLPLGPSAGLLWTSRNPTLRGVLDASATAVFPLTLHRATTAAAVGSTLYVAAVTVDTSTAMPRLSSVALPVAIVP